MRKQKTPPAVAKNVVETVDSLELKTITQTILRKINAEKIICFGCSITTKKNVNLFEENDGIVKHSSEPNVYYVLIIPSANESVPDILIQQRLETELKILADVTVIVHRMVEINAAIQTGNPFFTKIYQKGQLLHDRGDEIFIAPAKNSGQPGQLTRLEKYWNQWYELSQSFLLGAHFYSGEQRNNLAVFMLHQCLQHCYSAMLKVLTGYRSNSNSLKRLTSLIDSAMPSFSFAQEDPTPQSARLSALLMKGFSDARYSEKFNITDDELKTMMNRIETLLTEANRICLGHLKKRRNSEGVTEQQSPIECPAQ